jgi:glutaredoxin
MQRIYLIYGITDCPSCLMAQAILMQAEIEYVFIEMDFSKSYREAIKQEFDRSTFPIIVAVTPDGEELVGGYDDLLDCIESTIGI